MNLTAISTTTVVTAIVMGFVTIVLLIFPMVMYGKELLNVRQTGKSYIEIFTKVFMLHFVAVTICLCFCTLLNWMFSSDATKDFAPKYGVGLVLGMFDAEGKMNTSMSDDIIDRTKGIYDKVASSTVSASTDTVSGTTLKVIAAGTSILIFLQLFVYVLCICFPIFVTVIPAIYLSKNWGDTGQYPDVFSKIQSALFLYLTLLIISYMHFELTSVFVNGQLGGDGKFSVWGEIQTTWKAIFDAVVKTNASLKG